MSEKIRVLMVGTLPTDLQSVQGGVEAAILNLFAGFSQTDNLEVRHISFVKNLEEQKEIVFAPNIRIVFLAFRINSPLADYWLNRAALNKIVHDFAPHVIHIQESEPHLLRFIKFPKKNIVVTQHGIMREELKYVRGISRKLKFQFKAAVERYVFPMFKNVIFISRYNQKLFAGTNIKSAKIYNAVNPIFFEQSPVVSAHNNSLIYVGVVSPRKNLKLVIDALHELKMKQIYFTLHVVGGAKKKDAAYLREITWLVSQYGLSEQVILHGWLRPNELLEVYNQCGYFILPSLQETLPVSIAEALALGKVVLASNVGAVSEMFDDNVSGFLFEKNNLQQLVALLEHMNNNKQVASEVSSKARESALKKFHPVSNAERTIRFYKEIIDLENPPDHS